MKYLRLLLPTALSASILLSIPSSLTLYLALTHVLSGQEDARDEKSSPDSLRHAVEREEIETFGRVLTDFERGQRKAAEMEHARKNGGLSGLAKSTADRAVKSKRAAGEKARHREDLVLALHVIFLVQSGSFDDLTDEVIAGLEHKVNSINPSIPGIPENETVSLDDDAPRHPDPLLQAALQQALIGKIDP